MTTTDDVEAPSSVITISDDDVNSDDKNDADFHDDVKTDDDDSDVNDDNNNNNIDVHERLNKLSQFLRDLVIYAVLLTI